MRFSTLNEWLEWQQTLHWQNIELGLDRITLVASRLDISSVATHTIIVAGTNGKGSTVAYYSAFLQAAGHSVGCYTSPHLLKYNERIAINGVQASDDEIMCAFETIDQARQGISLSYFEFGTLAALLCIKQANVDVAVLEVGLGGRLDAVNIMDADLVHFTPIGIDHTAWLGDTRELIGFEKAGVLRKGCQVICNDADPPESVLKEINSYESKALYLNADYYFDPTNECFKLNERQINLSTLSLSGHHQKLNCCGVLAGLTVLDEGRYFDAKNIESALKSLVFKGRFETVKTSADLKTIIDVGHNADAATVLKAQLEQEQCRQCVMILGMLNDKAIALFAKKMSSVIDHCICVGLTGERGLSAQELSDEIQPLSMSKQVADNMQDALIKANDYLSVNQCDETVSSDSAHDIILVTGSFYTVEAYLTQTNES